MRTSRLPVERGYRLVKAEAIVSFRVPDKRRTHAYLGVIMGRRIARIAVAAGAALGLGLGVSGSASAATVPWWTYNGNQPNWHCAGTQQTSSDTYANQCVAVTGDYYQSVTVFTVHSTQWADVISQDEHDGSSRECAGTLSYGSYVCFGPTVRGSSGKTVFGISNYISPNAGVTLISPVVTLP